MTIPAFDHLDDIAGEIRAASHLILGLDFDGTLAPIVPHAKDAAMPRDTRTVLERLAARTDMTVAVISGRALTDLARLVSLNVILAGNHGLEIAGPGLHFLHPQAEKSRDVLRKKLQSLSTGLMAIDGVWIEDKDLTLSVHFRGADPARTSEIETIVRDALEETEFTARKGNRVLEILPRADWNKGRALLWIRDRLPVPDAAICYLGDDATDEDVFRVVHGVTVRVGRSESSGARFCVRDTVEAAMFLQWISGLHLNAHHSSLEQEPRDPESVNQ